MTTTRRARRTSLAGAAVVGAVMLGFVAVLATRTPALDKQAQSPLLGKPAPELAGTDIHGKPLRLTDFHGKYVVLNFFASWCVPCQVEHPQLQQFVARHAATGDASVVGVIFDDTATNARDFLGRNGGDWPVVDDPSGQITLDYGVRGPPESYLVSPTGLVLVKFVGGVSADGLDRVLTQAREAGA